VTAKSPGSTVLNEWPMIMAHDAATTYLKGGLFHQINDWAKTQADGGAKGMLDCGARAFDWRPEVQSDGTVKMHHGSVTIDHEMGASLDEMVQWAGSHGTDEADLFWLSSMRATLCMRVHVANWRSSQQAVRSPKQNFPVGGLSWRYLIAGKEIMMRQWHAQASATLKLWALI